MSRWKVNARSAALLIFSLIVAGVALSLQQPATSGNTYQVDDAGSHLLAVTGKTGIFSFAAHEHAILATHWKAEAQATPQQFSRSSIHIAIPVASLVIDSAEARNQAGLGSGPSADDVNRIQQRMLSPEILDAGKFPTIEFRSSQITVSSPDELKVTGEFLLHGQSKTVTVPVRYKRLQNGGFGFSAEMTIRQTDFGLKPETVAGGTVKVKNEVKVHIQLSLVPAR